MSTMTLEPCPFCGKPGPFDQWPCDWLDGDGGNVVRCPHCHGAAPLATWNRRAQPAQAVDVDSLAQEIRRVDGMHMLGAGALAEALMPFITRAISGEKAGPVDGWRGFTEDERARIVNQICEYGTEFVTPLLIVIDNAENMLRERNTTSPTLDKG